MTKLIRQNPSIISRAIEGEIILLDPKTGNCFGLKKVTASFWSLIDGVRTVDEIVDCLLEEYDVERATLTNDVINLMSIMAEKHLLETR